MITADFAAACADNAPISLGYAGIGGTRNAVDVARHIADGLEAVESAGATLAEALAVVLAASAHHHADDVVVAAAARRLLPAITAAGVDAFPLLMHGCGLIEFVEAVAIGDVPAGRLTAAVALAAFNPPTPTYVDPVDAPF